MKKYLFLILSAVFVAMPQGAEAATIKIYPNSGDGQAGIGSIENQTTWLNARSYEGIVSFTLQDTESTNSARSDLVSGAYRLYRGSLPFDTSVIPDDAVIQSATLFLYGQGTNGSQGGAKSLHNNSYKIRRHQHYWQ